MVSRTPAKAPVKKAPVRKAPAKKVSAGTTSGVGKESPEVDEIGTIADLGVVEQAETSETERPSGLVTNDGQALSTATLVFRGRTMVVKVPNEVQLSIMQRFSNQYGSMSTDDQAMVSAKKVITISGRAIGVIKSVLADEDDREWIEDSLLAEEFELYEALTIIQEAMRLLKVANAPNREERRTAEREARLVVE